MPGNSQTTMAQLSEQERADISLGIELAERNLQFLRFIMQVSSQYQQLSRKVKALKEEVEQLSRQTALQVYQSGKSRRGRR